MEQTVSCAFVIVNGHDDFLFKFWLFLVPQALALECIFSPAAGLTFLPAIAPALLYLLHPCSRASPQIAGAICTATLPEG
jgi:hypothetical protein